MKLRFSLLSLLFVGFLAVLGACKKDSSEEATPDYSAQDLATIQQYIQQQNLTGFRRDTLDVHLAVTQPGTGPNARKGQVVQVLYTGTLLDGTVFDTNRTTLGLPFTLGQSQVIRGWDAAFTRLNQGAKAILLIPSGAAYGATGAGSIPPNTVLRFDVEVVLIK